jgi:hypothetical protein
MEVAQCFPNESFHSIAVDCLADALACDNGVAILGRYKIARTNSCN